VSAAHNVKKKKLLIFLHLFFSLLTEQSRIQALLQLREGVLACSVWSG